MNIADFKTEHIREASRIALENYNEEVKAVPDLQHFDSIPDLSFFADNGLGKVAFENDTMIGFLCCYEPFENAFGSTATGTFSPIHAHGAIMENRAMIYKRLYQAAAKKWIQNRIEYHAVALYAHDYDAVNAMFSYGFGMRCVEAIRKTDQIEVPSVSDISFCEIFEPEQIRELRKGLSDHMGSAPCCMKKTEEEFRQELEEAENSDARLFVATVHGKAIAYIELHADGENFVTESPDILSICGAYCLPQYRGTGAYQNLLNYVINTIRSENILRLGVEFESFNPTAAGFWPKYFTPYTKSVVRRIDESAFR